MEPQDDILDTSRLCFNGDFNAQVNYILQHVRLSRRDVEDLQYLFDNLRRIFQMRWPGCEIHLFGSIVTGLGIKTSDVDCFVRLPNEEDVTNDTVFIARNLLRKYQMFGEVFAISSARVPIVKFLHYPTNCYCDVNFNSPSGIYNSRLISYYLQLDRKALELTVLIKYWSQVHKLTGTHLLSNYSLILLVIFYLQQKNVFPTVYELQNNTQPHYVNNWNTAIETPVRNFNNVESLYDMMGGFFKYYSNFDFKEQIVSPFLGRAINKAIFQDLDNVPEEFSLYKYNVFNKVCKSLTINRIMCIQDPFEHNRNCSASVYTKLANKVLLYFSFAAEKYEEEENAFLKAILTSGPVIIAENNQSVKNEQNTFLKAKLSSGPVNNAETSQSVNISSPTKRMHADADIANGIILNKQIAKNNKKDKSRLTALYQQVRKLKTE